MADSGSEIDSILAGDHRAFEAFVRRHERLVSHVVYRMIDNESDRQDICQDVFLRVYRNLGEFRGESKLSTWVARIAHNRCLHYLEKKKVPLYEDLCDEGETVDSVICDTALPDRLAEVSDLSKRMKDEIGTLPVHHRTALTLYHLDGMNYREIADIMGMPEGTIKSHLFRARKLLRERLLAKYRREEL